MRKTVEAFKTPVKLNINIFFDPAEKTIATVWIYKNKTLLKKSKPPPLKFEKPIKLDLFAIKLGELNGEEWKVIAVKELAVDGGMFKRHKAFKWHYWINRGEQAEFLRMRERDIAISVQKTIEGRAYLLAKLRRAE